MAILTPSQLTSASNATYFDNTSGSITPDNVRSLNNNWISSSILVSQTSSLSVLSSSYAATASVVTGTVVSSSYALTASFALNAGSTVDTGSFATTGSNQFNGNQSITGSLIVSGIITGSSLRIENNTHLDGTLTVTNDTLINGDVTIQSSTPNLKLRDTSGGGFSSGYDLRVDTGSFEIYDDTHNRDVLSDFFNAGTGKHTTSLTSEIIVISGSDSVTVLGPLTASFSNTFTGTNSFNIISASHASVLSASIDYLYVLYQTSSIVYSSGSNQFGDAPDDTQTLWGTVDIKTGPLFMPSSSAAKFQMNTSTQSLQLQKHNVLNELIVLNPDNNEKIIGFDYDTLRTKIQFGIDTGIRFEGIDAKGRTINISS
jgi:hypothetical protein